MGKEALAVKRDILFADGTFQGFIPVSMKNYHPTILAIHGYHARGDELENNMALQQIIPYIWIINRLQGKVFLYKRAPNTKNDGEHKETRYLGKYSGGVGGHIDRDTEEGSDNPIERAMMRELMEEVKMEDYPKPRIIGYINDDSDSIGRVHFGVVAIAEVEGSVESNEEGLEGAQFYSIEEVDNIFSDERNQVENWTKISWSAVKGYLMREG